MYNVIIKHDLCKKCGICMEFCPKNVFDLNEEGLIVPRNNDKCIGCKLCEYRCPDFAVKVEVSN